MRFLVNVIIFAKYWNICVKIKTIYEGLVDVHLALNLGKSYVHSNSIILTNDESSTFWHTTIGSCDLTKPAIFPWSKATCNEPEWQILAATI
jgi:hypothetical protein